MLNYRECILKTIEFVKQILIDDPSGHDWWHIERVRNMSLQLAEGEIVNTFVIEMAALLHDIVDDKMTKNAAETLNNVDMWLVSLKIPKNEIEQIIEIITTMSYKGGHNKGEMSTMEGKIVQDADRLDAIGAIGIARTFAYAGSRGNLIYNPDLSYRKSMTYDEYRNGKSTSINHFYEKLLKLAEQMNTDKAKILARDRHAFMEEFLRQFFTEWNGQA